MLPSIRTIAVFWLVALLVLILCQMVRFYWYPAAVINQGLAFGITLPAGAIFVIVILFLAAMIWLFYRHIRLGLVWAVVLGLVVGGGGSNLTDRLLLNGGVADYWHLGSLSSINLADVAVTAGVLAAMWLLINAYGTKNNF